VHWPIWSVSGFTAVLVYLRRPGSCEVAPLAEAAIDEPGIDGELEIGPD
jgi:hypothetical protein